MKRIPLAFFLSLGLLATLGAQNPVSDQAYSINTDPETHHTKGLSEMLTPWAKDLNPDAPLPEYPRPMMEREQWLNLNGRWEFQEAQKGEDIPTVKKLADEIIVPFPWESKLSGIQRQMESQRAWYRRTFVVPSDWNGARILLHFGAVDFEASVFVNRKYVGNHRGGYDAFSFDIAPFLKPKGEQEISIMVYDPGSDEGIAVGKQSNIKFTQPKGYSYTPSSGIWQTVWLEPVSEVYIKDIHIVPDIDREVITLTVDPHSQRASAEVEVRVLREGHAFCWERGKLNESIEVPIENPILWSPENPYLYDVEISLSIDGKQVDHIASYVGMRKISLGEGPKGLKQLFLNNEFLFQMGPLDQGYWPDGIYTAPTDEALRWDVVMMKEFGYNMVRKHIKIEPQRWYYWCDKEGLLVWQDMPSTFKKRTEEEKTQFETELQQMVKTHWNHPSIVNWIVFNEHWGLYDPHRLTEMLMAMDPSRLITGNSGIDAGRPNIDYEVGHIRDNHSYRPPNVPFASLTRATVCGEYGAIGYKVNGHVWDVDGPWVHHNYSGIEEATAEYERFTGMIRDFKEEGLSAAVYTQWTDLENEMNGIYTYDRKVIKLHKDRVRAANLSTYLPEKMAALARHSQAVHLMDEWMRDPYIELAPDGNYYLSCTWQNSSFPGEEPGMQFWCSRDLLEWEDLGMLWKAKDSDFGLEVIRKGAELPQAGRIWAPEAHFINGKWVVTNTSSEGMANLMLSEGPDLHGPWWEPFGADFGKHHDPSIFVDRDGTPWLVAKCAEIQRLKKDFSGFDGGPVAIGPSNRKMGHEGCYIIRFEDKYVLFGTAWSTDTMRHGTYNLYYCTADKIEGPVTGPFLRNLLTQQSVPSSY